MTTPVPGVGYKTVIDFGNAPQASDIWLFSKVTDLRRHISDLVVLLSPASNARSWYTIDPTTLTLTIFASRPTVVSYRLTAPRFDASKWSNIRPNDSLSLGFLLNDGQELAISSSGDVIGDVPDSVSNLTIEQTEVQPGVFMYQVKTAAGDIIQEVASLAEAVIGTLRAGSITTTELATDSLTIAGQ